MYTSLEIEFKSELTQQEYEDIISRFKLEGKSYTQTNFYFDTKGYELYKNHIILRIRKKEHSVKLTAKIKQDVGTLERHIILDDDKAIEMIEKGFNAEIIGLDYNVFNFAKLTTERIKIPYKSGMLFFDKNTYYDTVDYEVEFEADDEVKGKEEFNDFLTENNLKFKKLSSKSTRAYKKVI